MDVLRVNLEKTKHLLIVEYVKKKYLTKKNYIVLFNFRLNVYNKLFQ